MKQRFDAILAWCDKRDTKQVYSFFRSCNPKIEEHYGRIKYVMHHNPESINDADGPWVEMMEGCIEAINTIEQL